MDTQCLHLSSRQLFPKEGKVVHFTDRLKTGKRETNSIESIIDKKQTILMSNNRNLVKAIYIDSETLIQRETTRSTDKVECMSI